LKKQISLSKILFFISEKNFSIKNQKEIKITNFSSISSAKKGELTFCVHKDKVGLDLIKKSHASAILCHSSLKNSIKIKNSNLIFVDNPRIWFIRCTKNFFQTKTELKGIHPTAFVESKSIGKNVYVGAFSYIGDEVTIGDNTIIHSHVSISGKTLIGRNVTIKPSTMIGYDGFGFEKNNEEVWEKFPHSGSVIIEDDVSIGSNTCIDRGTLEQTKIGKGTKIDNLVHIAHNAHIGKNCYIVADSVVGGSCHIGDNVFLSIGTIIRNQNNVGDNSLIGIGSVVTKDIPKNSVAFGIPAKIISSRDKYDQTGSPKKIN